MEREQKMTTDNQAPRFRRLPKWAQQHIASLEFSLQKAQQTGVPKLDQAELWLGGDRLHLRNLNPGEVDVNFAGIFLDVHPKASNHITLTGRSL